MAIDKDLLGAAKAAGDRLAAVEQNAQVARVDYHQAVRRLHLAGSPLREVAQALGISHQRVQQIVQANGGTWWTRLWRTRRVGPDMICSFCGLPAAVVAKLIAGPEVFICDACVALADQVLRVGKPEGTAHTHTEGTGHTRMVLIGSPRIRCSFCRQKRDGRRIVGGAGNYVCSECLELCRRILDDRSLSTEPAGASP